MGFKSNWTYQYRIPHLHYLLTHVGLQLGKLVNIDSLTICSNGYNEILMFAFFQTIHFNINVWKNITKF